MKFTNIFFLILFFTFCSIRATAQNVPDRFHDSEGNTYHQLFFDFKVKEVLELKYTTDDSPVEGELSVDGFSIILKNYPGDKAVKVKLIDENGETKEVTKSKCFIDPVILQL